ncbi:MAG: VOC family protein [Spirochaetia bacterium]|nr:VOC family protein [Spirochaetia bacterium]
MNPVVHFEMPAENAKRVSEFYSKVFGWKNEMLGPEMGNYIVATTTESEDGRPTTPGTINGGFYLKEKGADEHPSVVIGVEDARAHIKKIEKAGGKILGEPQEIPGIGLYVSFLDTEGNKVSLLQPSR